MAERSRKSIIMVDNSEGPSGAAKSLKTIIYELHERFNFIVLAKNVSVFADVGELGVKLYQIPFLEIGKSIRTLLYPFKLVSNSYRLYKIIQQYKPVAVHVNDCYNMTGAVVRILSPNFKLIYHIRLLPTSYISSLYKYYVWIIFKTADRIICNSNAVYDAIPDSPKKIVIHNSIIPDSKDEQRYEKGRKIVYLGNYTPGKGHQYALNVIKCMKDRGVVIPVYFYGSTFGSEKNSKYKESLMGRARKLELTDIVHFEGFRRDIQKILAQAFMVFNFSVSESFSMVGLEAMWYGTLIVSLNSGGPADYIQDGETGILLEPGTDPGEAADRILEIIADKKKREEIETRGQIYVRSNFSSRKKAMEFYEVYSEDETA